VSARVYILLDIKKREVSQAVQTLQDEDGVKTVEALEGSPNILMMVQARNRTSLANLANHALASVEAITESVQLLPVLNKNNTRLLNENDNGKRQNKMPILRGK